MLGKPLDFAHKDMDPECSMGLNFGQGDILRHSHIVKLEPQESATITCPDSYQVKVISFEGEERTMEHDPTTLHGSNLTEGRYFCSHCPEAAIIAIKEAPSVEIEPSCSGGALRLDCEVNDQRLSGIDFVLGLTAEKPNGNWQRLKTGTNVVSINETELPDYADKVECRIVYFNIDGTNYTLHNFKSGDEHTIGPCQPTPTFTPEPTPQSNVTAIPSPTPTQTSPVIAAMTVGISLLLLLAVILIIVLLVLFVKRMKRQGNQASSVHPEKPPSDLDKPALGPSPISHV